jgi:hypothetical protein
LADASQLGFTFEEILALLRKRHEALNKGKSGGGER